MMLPSFGIALGSLAGVGAMPTTEFPAVARLSAVRELPDPFLFQEGTRVRTRDDWAKRRAEIQALVLHYQYGTLPPAQDKVTGREISSQKTADGNATETLIFLTMGSGGRVTTHLWLTIPLGSGPFPVLLRGDLGWGRVKPEIAAEVVRRGYILAEFNRVEVAPDSRDQAGVYSVYPGYEGGRLAAWAWGYHRVVDYLLTRKDVDSRHIAVTGHSRGGKAALLAGALDERIALTAPNNSGCGGAGCYRFQAESSEDIAAILRGFPYWFQPHFREFIGQVERLPFDQHSLKALVAPRALLTTEALGDLWANPEGTQQSHLAAKEVFSFLGASERIGIHFRPGPHEQNLEDWTTLMDFADQAFFGKKGTRKFDALAFPNSPKAFTWKAPDSSVKR